MKSSPLQQDVLAEDLNHRHFSPWASTLPCLTTMWIISNLYKRQCCKLSPPPGSLYNKTMNQMTSPSSQCTPGRCMNLRKGFPGRHLMVLQSLLLTIIKVNLSYYFDTLHALITLHQLATSYRIVLFLSKTPFNWILYIKVCLLLLYHCLYLLFCFQLSIQAAHFYSKMFKRDLFTVTGLLFNYWSFLVYLKVKKTR